MDPKPTKKRTAVIVASAFLGAALAGIIAYKTSPAFFRIDVMGFMFVAAVFFGHTARVIYDTINEDSRPKPRK